MRLVAGAGTLFPVKKKARNQRCLENTLYFLGKKKKNWKVLKEKRMKKQTSFELPIMSNEFNFLSSKLKRRKKQKTKSLPTETKKVVELYHSKSYGMSSNDRNLMLLNGT